MNYGF
jgi:hypothetical protein